MYDCHANTETFTMSALDIGQHTLHLRPYSSGGSYDLRVICDAAGDAESGVESYDSEGSDDSDDDELVSDESAESVHEGASGSDSNNDSSSDMSESAVAVSMSFFARHKEQLLMVLLLSNLALLAYVACWRGRGHKYATIYLSDTQTGADEETSENEEAQVKEQLV